MPDLPPGKLPPELLGPLLERYGSRDPRVLVGPRVGEDAAVIDMGDRCLVAKTDPVTFATDAIGWYAVNVNANDIACCGAEPRWFLATVLLPGTGADAAMVTSIFDEMGAACDALGVSLCGGHTEVTHGFDRPVVVGHMLGEAPREAIISTGGARPGDRLVLTKGIAVEGTAILAREKAGQLSAVMGADALERAARFLYEPGISVVRDARVAIAAGGVHALHDPTEGGLATALAEVAHAANVGLLIDEEAIPVLDPCRVMCEHLGLDPLGLIASGALLAAVAPESVQAVVRALEGAGIGAHEIGEVTEAAHGSVLRGQRGERPLPRFDRDELARIFG